jgi:outer membrane receptor protein involved in Fe transport
MPLERRFRALAPAAVLVAAPLGAQVTTASVAGRVLTEAGAPVTTGQVTAVHQPSGTTYRASTRADGRYTIPGMRVGGPYAVTVRALGYAPATREGLNLSLGTTTELDLRLQQAAVQLSTVAVTAASEGATLSSARTGAATRVTREVAQALPTISRSLNDITRLTPQASGGGSFLGVDSRLNNITIDGSFFNNSFGLGGQPGSRTGVSPIPQDAIEQVQVNIAPYDVRQGNFVGAGVNAVTRSGTNNFEGSVYYFTRDQGLAGRRAGPNPVNVGTFEFGQFGARLGGPILKNRLFFFANYETDENTSPATTWTANPGGQPVQGTVTRVLASDLQRVSDLLSQRFAYNPGSFQDIPGATPSTRFTGKLDLNAGDRNKFSLRYTMLNSSSYNLISNSQAIGFGNRRTNANAVAFANSGYDILENIRSTIGEWNSQVGGRASNQLIVGYTSNDESRRQPDPIFPTIDILRDGATYISVGTDPFTPQNQLRYSTFQFQDNFTFNTTKHEITVGVTAERFKSENVFIQGANSAYVYNSLEDFFADLNGHLANPTRTTSPVTLRRFQLGYTNIPGLSEPLQELRVNAFGGYLQDQWRVTDRVTLTGGVRLDLPTFAETGYANAQANGYSYVDHRYTTARYQTEALPKRNLLWSPRVGFNVNLIGDRATQLRGGTGIFTGRPPYVWISNQLGNNGIITGALQVDNTTARPFNPNPTAYAPSSVTGNPAASYQLNFTDPGFRFPQVWRSNVAVDQRLPLGLVGTLEFLYGRDVNGVRYWNANLPAPQGRLSGADARPRWTSNRLNSNVTGAFSLGNQDEGYNWNLAASLERAFQSGFFAKTSYSYGVARNLFDPGTTAATNFTVNQQPGDPNRPPLSNASGYPGHNFLLALSYRREYFRIGGTTISTILSGFTGGADSYTATGDLNNDGTSNNDLLYVQRDPSETQFEQYTAGTGAAARTFTVAQQQAAWDKFVNDSEYLNDRRGGYAERNGVLLPMIWRADVSVAQDVFRAFGSKTHNVQVRLDVINATNLLNKNWGGAQRLQLNQPLAFQRVDATGRPAYRLRALDNQNLITADYQQTGSEFIRTASLADVYRMQLGFRYLFR